MWISKKLIIKNFLSHKDTEFEFSVGKAKVVIGENLDDSGQKGNGAGKSSLNEAISVCITGGSIRPVLTRELIRNGEESCELTYILDNKVLGKELSIKRTLYSKASKSSKCSILINDEEVIKSDITEYNRFILELIGITKDDFFNYFLITKEQYKPFLLVGDREKKETINRFSGANSIDEVFGFIDKDLSEKTTNLQTKSNSTFTTESEIEFYKNRIVEEEEKVKDTYIDQLVKNLENELQDLISQKNEVRASILSLNSKQETNNKLVDLKNSKLIELENLINPYSIKINELQTLIEKYSEDSKKVASKYKSEVDEILKTEKETELLKTEFESELTKLNSLKKTIENKLLGIIVCPKCSHEFITSEKEFDVEKGKIEVLSLKNNIQENKELLSDITGLYGQIEIDKESIRKKVSFDKENINKEILKFNDQISIQLKTIQNYKLEISEIKSEISLLLQSNSGIEKEKQIVNKQIERLSIEILSYNETLIPNAKIKDRKTIEQLEIKLSSLRNSLDTIQKEKDVLVQETKEIENWEQYFKSFKSNLANQSIQTIADYTNFFLERMQSNITINIEGYKVLSDKRVKEQIITKVFKDGFEEGSYGKFSAGERGRIEICCILALQELINLNTEGGGLDLLICDEILDSLDTMGLENIVNSLQTLEKTIMIVSQNEINSLSSSTIMITKQNKISTVYVN